VVPRFGPQTTVVGDIGYFVVDEWWARGEVSLKMILACQ
jgi:hypothetical protein